MSIPPFSSPPTPSATSTVQGKLELTNDLGGTATAPTVVATHLSSALPLAQGGLGFNASGIAKGGLISGTGAGTAGITTVGGDGTVLSADSGSAGGIKWIAAGGTGTVTTVSVVTANGVSGSVANPTTTPAITITLGAITPSSVNSVVLSGSSTPTLAVTGTSTISGANTGDQTITLTSDVTGSGTGSFATTIKTNVGLAGSPTTTTQSAGDNSTKIATTAFTTTAINNAISGVNPAVAVQAATTAAGDTSGFTYNNGVSGVGATLTQNSAAVYVVDGFTFNTLNQRLLVKNDTQSPSGAFNGVYYVTTVGTGIIPAVLTRALDYNSPSDINNTGAIPVVNGTVNALTSWLLTSQVTTVGTDPLTYSQFSRSPTSVLPPNLGGTGIANNASSTLTISGSFGTTITVSGTTSVTLPTSGTLYGTASGSITSSQLATSLTDETGSGAAVFATSPTLVTPALGTPSAIVLTNATGTAASLTAGTVTTNANLTGDVTSSGNATTLAAGSASNLNSGTLNAARMPALTGGVTSSAGSVATTVASLSYNNLTTFSNPYKFSAYKNTSTQTVNTGSATIVVFDAEEFDTNNNFTSNTYTAPVTGFYQFTATLNYNAVASGTRLQPAIYVNAAQVKIGNDQFTNAAQGSATVTAIISLTAADTVDVRATPIGANTVLRNNSIGTYFQGHLVSIT